MEAKRRSLCGLLLLFAALPVVTAVRAQDGTTIERREAAVGFLYSQATALAVLRRECKDLLPASESESVDQVARAWWERNRADLDTSAWIVGQAITRYRAQGDAQQAKAKEQAMLQAFANGMLPTLRSAFARQLPNASTCAKAIASYRRPEADLRQAAQLSTPMQATLQSFVGAFDETRRDPAFRLPEERFRTLDAQIPVASQALLTHDAIDAAKARADGATVIRGYESLAARGDATAAQTLGVAYLEGRWAARSPQAAASWFYNAWTLGEIEGLNALGVVWRDGLTAEPDPAMALAAFAATMQSKHASPQAAQRAFTNLERLMAKATPPMVSDAACIKPSTLHAKARLLAAASGVALNDALPTPADDFPMLGNSFTGPSRPSCLF
jgi:hypothetical protein